MNHNLGKVCILFFYIFHTLGLQADDFFYNFNVDNTHPYVKEAVILTLDVKQTNHDIVLLFNFDLLPSKDYSFQRIDIKEIDTYHAVEIQYTYLVYPLKSGTIDINFTLTQKATTDESVAYSFSGDRDNVKTLETKDSEISLPPMRLEVTPLPLGTQIVGDFVLDYKVKSLEAKAYEPLPFQVSIKGMGYPPLLDSLLPKDVNFTTFTESPLLKETASKQGTYSTVVYPMAISHDKSFTLDDISIKAFEPKTKRAYTLHVPTQYFTVTEVNQQTLVDTVNNPVLKEVDWSWVQTLMGYLIIFFAGYITALVWKNSTHTRQFTKGQHPLVEKIQNTKTLKTLLQILLSHDAKKFTATIEKLETSLYRNNDDMMDLKTLKKEALEILK